jgi:hypothetical protein
VHFSAANRPARQLDQLPLADHDARREPRASLRHAADDLERERLAEPPELRQRGGELVLRQPGEMDPEEPLVVQRDDGPVRISDGPQASQGVERSGEDPPAAPESTRIADLDPIP